MPSVQPPQQALREKSKNKRTPETPHRKHDGYTSASGYSPPAEKRLEEAVRIFGASGGSKYFRIDSLLWMDEMHFAPPKKPCKCQQTMVYGFKVVQDFVHSQYDVQPFKRFLFKITGLLF